MKFIVRAKWISSALICVCCAANSSALAQAKPGRQPATFKTGGSSSEIRHVDFRNFTFVKPGNVRAVRLSNGKFEDDDNAYTIDRIIFGDLNGDRQEEAVVSVLSEYKKAANPMEGETVDNYVYTMRNGKATLLTMVDEGQILRDYQPYLRDPNRLCNQFIGTPVMRKITHGLLVVAAAGGGRFCPTPMKYDVTLQYRWNGARFALAGKPLVTRTAKSRP